MHQLVRRSLSVDSCRNGPRHSAKRQARYVTWAAVPGLCCIVALIAGCHVPTCEVVSEYEHSLGKSKCSDARHWAEAIEVRNFTPHDDKLLLVHEQLPFVGVNIVIALFLNVPVDIGVQVDLALLMLDWERPFKVVEGADMQSNPYVFGDGLTDIDDRYLGKKFIAWGSNAGPSDEDVLDRCIGTELAFSGSLHRVDASLGNLSRLSSKAKRFIHVAGLFGGEVLQAGGGSPKSPGEPRDGERRENDKTFFVRFKELFYTGNEREKRALGFVAIVIGFCVVLALFVRRVRREFPHIDAVTNKQRGEEKRND